MRLPRIALRLSSAALLLALSVFAPAGISLQAVGIRALDGDSILAKLPSGLEVEVRLLHVDAPEHGQLLADEAKSFTHTCIAGRTLTLVTEVDQRDRYNRLLAIVSVADRCVNLELVEAGLAHVFLIPPNTSRADEFLAAQERAHAAKKGMWGGGPMEEPRSFRARVKRGEKVAPAPLLYEGWLIVGNRKSCVAHWPGCHHVQEIEPANRVAFSSVAEVKANKYRMEKGYK